MKYRAFMNNIDNLLKNNSINFSNISVPLINSSIFLFLFGFTTMLVITPDLSLTFNLLGINSVENINESLTIQNSFFITACFIFITIIRFVYFLADILSFGLFCLKKLDNFLIKLIALKKEQNYKEYRKNIPKYPY